MAVTIIDAKLLQRMFLAGAQNLDAKKEWINELNVFPVPDGDTGTNMTLTIMSAAKEVNALGEEPTMELLAKAVSSGSLRGARGNSGVILSQLFRGFTKEIKKVDVIDAEVLARACTRAVETAYRAVMKPKEGTILTVARGISEKVNELAGQTSNLEELIPCALEYGDEVLARTPELLPVLKQAGVVDSGGQGLMQVLKGAYEAFLGKELVFEKAEQSSEPSDHAASSEVSGEAPEQADIKFGYCTEFIVNIENEYTTETEQEFKSFLESIGDSIVLVSDDNLVKVHVHTNHPGLAFEKGLTYGSLSRMKVDNMREEHHEKLIKDAERIAKEQKALEEEKEQEKKKNEVRKDSGFIAVSIGSGLNEIFKGLGVDYIIEGGQTMNPSTEDMLNAIERVNADHIYILPNNKNIILAAEQAKKLTKDKDIIVIPSKTVPQGIAAVINFMPEQTVEENTQSMTEEMGNIRSGQVTYAVRDTNLGGKVIHVNDIMGIDDEGIQAVGSSIADTTLELAASMISDDSELVSVYYGEEISEETANDLAAAIGDAYPGVEVEVNYGGQPIYYYMISVE